MLRSSGVQKIGSSRQSMKTYSTTKDVAIVRIIMKASIFFSDRVTTRLLSMLTVITGRFEAVLNGPFIRHSPGRFRY
ncbi:hypothetical protein CFBP5473_07415 [Agrobacterium larrymoorei]|uniref:Uncharacterized protein n=1 Tax=Agrobacterium larrymoorei TaxID=160699 RepID=A0A4D7DQF2_9HYPH|nr:hypothetical protein CFBP5473_07415 [Agrobacterium larrymoorei]